MPLAVIHMTQGALGDSEIARAVLDITEAFLRAQGAIEGSSAARSIARVDVVEARPGRSFLGGVAVEDVALYRVVFSTPAGALSGEAREALVASTTAALMAAEGIPDPSEEDRYRVWCMFDTVPEGEWACGGIIYTWRMIKRWVAQREIALRRAASGRPRRPVAEPQTTERRPVTGA